VAGRTLTLLVIALVAVSTAAAGQPVPEHYYLSLGDSLAYGMQPDKAARGLPPSGFSTGYTDVVANRLRALNPKLEVVNYSCPGESTVTYVRGHCEWLTEGKKLHDPFPTTQEQAALAFLRTHKGEVSPITLTLWGNDIFPAFDTCRTLACIKTRAPKVLTAFIGRFAPIIARLRAAAPDATIVVTGPWNFDAPSLKVLAGLYGELDAAMRRAATAAGARFADVRPLFNPSVGTKARICAYSFICSADDPHPTDAGYRAYAKAILAAAGY